MKTLISLMIGMGLLFGTVSAVFGQEPPKKEEDPPVTHEPPSPRPNEAR